MRRWLVVAIVVTFARPALAGDRVAEIKAMLETQRKALLKGDDAAFKATLAPDALVSLDGDAPTKEVRTWHGSWEVSKAAVVDSHVGWSGTWGWLSAELDVSRVGVAEAIEAGGKPRPGRFHLLALVVLDGNAVKTKVLVVTPTKLEKDIYVRNEIQELVPRTTSKLVALLAAPSAIASQLANDPAATVFGSAPTERAYGAAAKKLIGGWSKLTLEVVDTKRAEMKPDYEPLEVSFGDVTVVWARVRYKLPAKKDWFLLDAFAIARKAGDSAELVAVMYGALD
jgi:hypothetical protein